MQAATFCWGLSPGPQTLYAGKKSNCPVERLTCKSVAGKHAGQLTLLTHPEGLLALMMPPAVEPTLLLKPKVILILRRKEPKTV